MLSTLFGVPVLVYVPLVLAVVLLGLPVGAGISARVQKPMTSLALLLFGSYVVRPSPRRQRRRVLLLSARTGVTYRVYAARTLLYAATGALGGSILGIYAIVLGLRILAIPEEALAGALPDQLEFLVGSISAPTLSPLELFVLFLISSATFGAITGLLVYLNRWSEPTRVADMRETMIDESLPRTVAVMFALSRSGMSHRTLVEILAQNSVFFGEAAEEFVISLRYMKLTNADFLTATQQLARTTPSTEFANFTEDLTDVLRTGRRMSEYFREEYEQYQLEKESRQQRILDQLAALAEAYVALLVAGPLFLITILVIIGLLAGGTLGFLRLLVYVLIPMVSIGFLYYLNGLTAGLGIDIDAKSFRIEPAATPGGSDSTDRQGAVSARTDGGVGLTALDTANAQRLAMYRRLSRLRTRASAPVQTAIRNPDTVLYVTAPIATLWVLGGTVYLLLNDAVALGTVDDFLIQGALILLAPFAVAEYFHDRRLDRVEKALPDFIARLADRTEAGVGFSRSIRGLDPQTVPGLEPEIRELSADIGWGARVSEALKRFAERSESVFAVRAVVLIINAAQANNNVAPVLRIAANEAQLDRRLDQRRREELLIYLIIIYVSFIIFIGITVVLVTVFIPSIPSAADLATGGEGDLPTGGLGFGAGTEVDRDAYSLLLFHSTMVQGAIAGFVAGKMAEGSVRAGAKHATLMIAVAYLVMLVL